MAYPSVVINEITYATCPQVHIPKTTSGEATFYSADECTVTAAHVLSGDKFIGASGEGTGLMPSNGSTGGTISTKAGTVTIPAGHTTGGTVSLASSAVSDLVAGNLLSGKTVLGVAGSLKTVSVSQNSTTHVLTIS